MRHVAAVALGAILLVTPVAAGVPASAANARASAASETGEPPDIVLIVTDDQRWDSLWAMPILSERLAGRGVTFPDAFVVNPLCCPSRASILTGNYSHTHLVYRQIPPFGRFEWFHDGSTLATWLHDEGYRTGLFGKYIDGYQHAAVTGYIPPGWDRWVAFVHSAPVDYTLTIDGALHANDEPVGMAVEILALARMVRQLVRRLEVEDSLDPHARSLPLRSRVI